MRTALDANVISALWSNEPTAGAIALSLGSARQAGALVVSAPVYAELLAHPTYPETAINKFMAETGISIDFDLPAPLWLDAGRRFAKYAARRRRATGQEPKRLLADFIIGAHALGQADRFMTLDPARYKRDFPDLKLI
jgi:predicted nucleic acid-binding protein